jgi:hypothetical protein
VALQPVVDAHERGLGPAVRPGQIHDAVFSDSRDRGDARRCVLACALSQFRRAERVPGEIVVVLEPLSEDDMHHAERERRVGSRTDTDPLVALIGGARANRVDRDDSRAVLMRPPHERPEVRVRGERVRSPQEHEVALWQSLAVGAGVRADGHLHADGARHRADRAIELRGAEEVEEAPVHRRALHEPHRARIRIGKDRLRPVARLRDGIQPRGDRVERLVPGGALELSTPLRAHPPEGCGEPVAMIRALEIPVDLGAEESLGKGMAGVALDARGATVFHGYQRRARIRAVVGTCTADDTRRGFIDCRNHRSGHRQVFEGREVLQTA